MCLNISWMMEFMRPRPAGAKILIQSTGVTRTVVAARIGLLPLLVRRRTLSFGQKSCRKMTFLGDMAVVMDRETILNLSKELPPESRSLTKKVFNFTLSEIF